MKAGPDLQRIIHQESKRGIADYTVPENCFLIASVVESGRFDYYIDVDGVRIYNSSSSTAFPHLYLNKNQVVSVNKSEGVYTMVYCKAKII